MDKQYIKAAIENIERERQVHNQKFASNVAHKNCLQNFDAALQRLGTELEKLAAEDASPAVNSAYAKPTV